MAAPLYSKKGTETETSKEIHAGFLNHHLQIMSSFAKRTQMLKKELLKGLKKKKSLEIDLSLNPFTGLPLLSLLAALDSLRESWAKFHSTITMFQNTLRAKPRSLKFLQL